MCNQPNTTVMFAITPGIDKYATVTELRSNTSELIDNADTGILIQKNNKPLAVLMSYDRFLDITGIVLPDAGDSAQNDAPETAEGPSDHESEAKSEGGKKGGKA